MAMAMAMEGGSSMGSTSGPRKLESKSADRKEATPHQEYSIPEGNPIGGKIRALDVRHVISPLYQV